MGQRKELLFRFSVCVWFFPSQLNGQNGWHGFQGNTKGYQEQHAFQPTGWLQDISKLQCSLSSVGVWETTISKTSTFKAPKFSQIFFPFVPLGSAGFCLRLGLGRGSWGYTPLHLAARERPRRGCPTAPRGQGGRECGEKQMWPWPRTSRSFTLRSVRSTVTVSCDTCFLQVSQLELEPQLFHVIS